MGTSGLAGVGVRRGADGASGLTGVGLGATVVTGVALVADLAAAFSGGPAYGRTDDAVGFFDGGAEGGFWGMSQALWQGARVIRQPQINSTVINA
jgi:hypothetical protein